MWLLSLHTRRFASMRLSNVRLKCASSRYCRVPKLDEFIITLSNIGRAEHIRGAVGGASGEALRPPPADAEAACRQESVDMHSPAGAPAAASLPMPRLPATPLAETPLYAKRLGRPPVTPGDTHRHPPCCNPTAPAALVRSIPHQCATPARPKRSSDKRGSPSHIDACCGQEAMGA